MNTAARASAFTEPDRPKGLLIRFVTVGGSYVDVTGPGHSSDTYSWTCRGCKETSDCPDQDYVFRVRRDANVHAGLCRAIPLA